MKIIIITDQYPPIEYGGMSQHAYHMCEYLSDKHELVVILPKNYKDKIKKEKYRIESVLTMKYQKYDNFIVMKIADKFKPDVIHVCTAGMVYKKLAMKYPTVLRVVGNDFMRPWRGKSIMMKSLLFRIPIQQIKNYLLIRQMQIRKKDVISQMMQCSKIVSNSQWTKERLIENNIEKSKIEMIVGGYDVSLFVPTNKKRSIREKIGIGVDKKIIITAANLVGKKGIDNVIKAVSKLVKKYDIEYYIIGDGEEMHNLKNLSEKLKIEDKVHFEGRKNQKELSEYYQSADIYVQVSRNQYLINGGVDVETMGRTYIEAGACGIPVIASRLGGIPSVIEHETNGLLINNAEDINELVELIKKVFDDKEMSSRISENAAIKSKENYSWEKVVYGFEKIFYDVRVK